MKKNIQWLPILASVGVGAATYSLMTGQGGQLQNALPGIAKMTNQLPGQSTQHQ
ncbi:hypothetical protein [Halobacillus salinus]|uniref:hypothetical protein n=1 Tax=Halobacillus salinus TaxID=192814 RepID=UPI0014576846|nr:hypothetical protein [Halobacillus salinus]